MRDKISTKSLKIYFESVCSRDMSPVKNNSKSLWEKLEIYLNTLNHVFIGICMFYNFWYCINFGFDGPHTWHEMCCSLGFNLLMAEGILAMYSGNTLTLFTNRTNKKWIHGVLQAAGGGFGLAGFIIEIPKQMTGTKRLFDDWHAITGEIKRQFIVVN